MSAPTPVLVFGILNIVFGALGICGLAFTATVLFGMTGGLPPGQDPFAAQGPVLAAWFRISLVIGMIATVVLVVAGIGLLMMRGWGRSLSVGYAIYSIAATVLTTVLQGWFVVAPMLRQAERGPEAATQLFTVVGGLAGSCVGLIYPVLLWYFMTRPPIVAALSGRALGVEPLEAAVLAPAGPIDAANPYVSPRTEATLAPEPATATAGGTVVETLIPSRNGPALASYYLGLFSLLPCFGFPLGVAAVYFGIKGLRNVRQNPAVRGGVHAWVGVVCGGLFGLANFALAILFVIGLVASATRR